MYMYVCVCVCMRMCVSLAVCLYVYVCCTHRNVYAVRTCAHMCVSHHTIRFDKHRAGRAITCSLHQSKNAFYHVLLVQLLLH